MTIANETISLLLEVDDKLPAIQDDADNSWLNYGELKQKAAQWVSKFSGDRGLIFLFIRNDTNNVAAFLGALASNHAVALFDPDLSKEVRDHLIKAYEPQWIVDTVVSDVPLYLNASSSTIHKDLSVLLSTSGSTGSPKLVRLTLDNIVSNAHGIRRILEIQSDDVACAHLPLHYSFGLSVLTSHFVSGARIKLTSMGFTDREFWPAMRQANITHLPGVPFHFKMMQRLSYKHLNIPSLRSLVQAGGFLDLEARRHAYHYMETAGGSLSIMYGQTEASPRMTTLSHASFENNQESVGIPLPDCKVIISNADDKGWGEVEFHGPNVMMGYAESRADLKRGDELGGKLSTGDIGYLNDDNLLTLVGRTKRFSKIYGLRVNHDEIEVFINKSCTAAVTQHGDSLYIYIQGINNAGVDEQISKQILIDLKKRYTLPASCYIIKIIKSIPVTERGKVDYNALELMQ